MRRTLRLQRPLRRLPGSEAEVAFAAFRTRKFKRFHREDGFPTDCDFEVKAISVVRFEPFSLLRKSAKP